MKIVCWNLKNIGTTKLKNKLGLVVSKSGYGANVLSYITKVVMANKIWQPVMNGVPVDVFVLIELKTGGKAKGAAVSSTATTVMNDLAAAMNAVAAKNKKWKSTYHYSAAEARVTGFHECVGVIYNDKLLAVPANGVDALKTVAGAYLPQRTPYKVTLQLQASGAHELHLVGVHAPPPKGSGATPDRFRAPIDFCRQLGNLAIVQQATGATPETVAVMGDFNCSPLSSYGSFKKGNKKQKVTIKPFDDLKTTYAFDTAISDGTLTSMATTFDKNKAGPARYCVDAYDNVFHGALNAMVLGSDVLDLIANATQGKPTLFPASGTALVNSYWKVSDHLPVYIEY